MVKTFPLNTGYARSKQECYFRGYYNNLPNSLTGKKVFKNKGNFLKVWGVKEYGVWSIVTEIDDSKPTSQYMFGRVDNKEKILKDIQRKIDFYSQENKFLSGIYSQRKQKYEEYLREAQEL